MILAKENNVFQWYIFFFSFKRYKISRLLSYIRLIDMFFTFKLNPFTYSFFFKLFLDLAITLLFYSFSSSKLLGYFSCNSSLISICIFSTTFCVSAINNYTKHFSLSYKTEFHWLLKSSEIGLIAGSFFIPKPNGIICFSNANL